MGKKFIILILTVLLVASGCGEKMPDQDTSELFLLDESGNFSVWWDGTPGSNDIQHNVSTDTEKIELFFLVKNNSDEKLDLELSCDNIDEVELEKNELSLKPGQIKKLSVSFPISSLVAEENMLGQYGPGIFIREKSSEEGSLLGTCIQVNDPGLAVEWGYTNPHGGIDYTDTFKNTVKITNTSDSTKEVFSYRPDRFTGIYYLDDNKIVLEPGEECSLEYDVFYVKQNCEDCLDSQQSHILFLESSGYFFSNQIFTSLSDCQEWEFRWSDYPDENNLNLDIADLDPLSFDIEIINPCDRDRTFKPRKYNYKAIKASFEKNEYKIPANSSVKTKLDFSFVNSSSLDKITSLNFDHMKDSRILRGQNFTLSLEYNPPIFGKPSFESDFVAVRNNSYRCNQSFYSVFGNNLITTVFDKSGLYGENCDCENQVACLDLKTGTKKWSFSDSTVSKSPWYRIIDGNLFLLTTVKGRGLNKQMLVSINLESGQISFETEEFPACKAIILNNETLVFKSFDHKEQKQFYYSVELQTGEFTKSETLEEEKAAEFYDSKSGLEGKNSTISKLISNETIWETQIKHKFVRAIRYLRGAPNKGSTYWFEFTDIDEGYNVYFSEGFYKLDDPEKLYYLFSDYEFSDYCCEAESLDFDGIGCIDKETGELLWETKESIYLPDVGIDGHPAISIYDDYLTVGDTKYSKNDGEKIGKVIEKDVKPEPQTWHKIYEYSHPDEITVNQVYISLDDKGDYKHYATYIKKGDEKPFYSRIYEKMDSRRSIYVEEKDLFILFLNDKTLFFKVPK